MRESRAAAGRWLGVGLLTLACSGGVRLGPLAVDPPAGWNLLVALFAAALLLGPGIVGDQANRWIGLSRTPPTE